MDQSLKRKNTRWKGPAIAVCSIVAIVAFTYWTFKNLAGMKTPVANMVGNNSLTARTAKVLAISQAEAGRYNEAARNFDTYFRLGGDEPAAMALYAVSLAAIGQNDLAKHWAEKSKAAKFIEKQ